MCLAFGIKKKLPCSLMDKGQLRIVDSDEETAYIFDNVSEVVSWPQF